MTLGCGPLRLITLLVLLPRGRPQCYKPTLRTFNHVSAPCCETALNDTINLSVDACFEQMANTSPACSVHAFIFTRLKEVWCVDPRASWLQDRFRKLRKRKICCQII